MIDIALATGGITYSKEPTIISVPRLEVSIAIIFTRFVGLTKNPELVGNVKDDKLNPLGLGLGVDVFPEDWEPMVNIYGLTWEVLNPVGDLLRGTALYGVPATRLPLASPTIFEKENGLDEEGDAGNWRRTSEPPGLLSVPSWVRIRTREINPSASRPFTSKFNSKEGDDVAPFTNTVDVAELSDTLGTVDTVYLVIGPSTRLVGELPLATLAELKV